MLCHVTYCTEDMLTHRQHTSDDIIVASIYFSRIKDKRAWKYKEAGKTKLSDSNHNCVFKTTVALDTNTAMFLSSFCLVFRYNTCFTSLGNSKLSCLKSPFTLSSF